MGISPLHVAFTDFGRSFDPEDHLLLVALAAHRDVEVVDPEAAEILFFGVFGDRHRSFVGTKVHWTGENRRPPTSLRVPTFAFNVFADRRRHFDVPPGPPGPTGSSRADNRSDDVADRDGVELDERRA